MTRPSGTLETPKERKDLKQNSNGKPNNWATNLSPSNPRLHNESLQTAGVAGVPWKLYPGELRGGSVGAAKLREADQCRERIRTICVASCWRRTRRAVAACKSWRGSLASV